MFEILSWCRIMVPNSLQLYIHLELLMVIIDGTYHMIALNLLITPHHLAIIRQLASLFNIDGTLLEIKALILLAVIN